MELNREQIIKALECCTKVGKCGLIDCKCDDCPYDIGEDDCKNLDEYALALIKELTEESQRWQQAYDCSDSACRELSSKCDELTAKTDAQDIVILELRKSLEKANHDADRYTLKIKELTEEVEGLQRELASRPPRLVITKLPKESEKEDV